MVDWQAVKTEYITTATSYQKLADKYGVSKVQVGNVGRREGWVTLREQFLHETFTDTVDSLKEKEVERARNLSSAADQLLSRIQQIIDCTTDPVKLRSLCAALRDLKDLYGLKSKLDNQEQEARIAHLRHQTEKDAGGTEGHKVVIEGLPEEFKV